VDLVLKESQETTVLQDLQEDLVKGALREILDSRVRLDYRAQKAIVD